MTAPTAGLLFKVKKPIIRALQTSSLALVGAVLTAPAAGLAVELEVLMRLGVARIRLARVRARLP